MDKHEKQKNAIVAASMRLNGAGLVLRSAEDLKLASELFKNAGLAPKWCDTPAKAAFVIEAGQEIGLKPVQALNSFQLINGQLGIKAQAIAGLIRGSGKAEYLKDSTEGKAGSEDYKVVVHSKRKDDPNEKMTEFSIAEAIQAGLATKDNWKHYPQDMLWCRAMARHGRRYYSDVLCGFYTTEELSEIVPPEAQPTPEAPGREERKKVDAKVTDTPATIAELVEEGLDFFRAAVSEKLDVQLGGMALYYFTQCVSYILGGEADSWKEHKNWTIEGANKLLKELKENGVPQVVLDMIPHSVSEAEADKTAEDKFGQESTEKGDLKYQCQSPKCGKYFDKPKRGGKLPGSNDYAKLCPHCLTDDIVNREEATSVTE